MTMKTADLEHVQLNPSERQRFTLRMTEEEYSELTEPQRLKYHRAQLENVYGHGVKFKNGVPQEIGIGSEGNETENHFRALEAQQAGRAMNEAVLNSLKRGAG
jgi:hypothetical protein